MKLKKSSMAAASSSSTSTMTSPFDSLPDELLLKIMKFAAEPPKDNGMGWNWEVNKGRTMAEMGEKYDHDFLANRISKVSTRFRRVVADESLWKGVVWIGPRSNLETIEFVCRECLNGGTTAFHMPGNLSCDEYWYSSGGFPNAREVLISQITIIVSKVLVEGSYDGLTFCHILP